MIPERFIKPSLGIIAISMVAWLSFWVIIDLLGKRDVKKMPPQPGVTAFLLYTYAIGVLSLTIFPLPFYRFKEPNGKGINVIPFVSILKGIVAMFMAHEIFSGDFQNIVGNIILFIPLGILVPLLFNQYRSIKMVALVGCCCSTSIELTQLILRQFEIYRTVDIDDVVLNTTGAIIGYMLWKAWHVKKHK